jgi:hypothetical protein
MSWRRLNNLVHEAVQTYFSDSDSDPTMEGEDTNQNVDANGDDPNAFLDNADTADQGAVAEQDLTLEAAQAAVDAANNVVAALPPAPQTQQGADPTTVMRQHDACNVNAECSDSGSPCTGKARQQTAMS